MDCPRGIDVATKVVKGVSEFGATWVWTIRGLEASDLRVSGYIA